MPRVATMLPAIGIATMFALQGCGSNHSPSSSQPSTSPPPSSSPTPPTSWRVCRENAVPGEVTSCSVRVSDEGALEGYVHRNFNLYLPNGFNLSSWWHEKYPLMLHFHGAKSSVVPLLRDPDLSPYKDLADEFQFIIIYPQGTYGGERCGYGWRVISGGHNPSTCTNASFPWTCCPASCKRLGKCRGNGELANCGFTQCYDEQGFVEVLLSLAVDEFGVDSRQIYATGASEGGALLYDIMGRLPADTFKAVVPVYAAPFAGFLKINSTAPILSLHGRWDTRVPVAGGVSDDGWIYMPEADIMVRWAESLGCLATELTAFPIPFPSDSISDISCTRFDSCSAPSVVQCLYDGVHGDWPSDVANQLVVWWFFRSGDHAMVA